jgi:Na+/H+-dicarboxylate symporter
MIGGSIRAITEHFKRSPQKGILAASGLVAGDACMGVLIALFTITNLLPENPIAVFNQGASLVALAFIAVLLGLMAMRGNKTP